MIGNVAMDIWIHTGVGPVVKYKDDCNVFHSPVAGGKFQAGDFSYNYNRTESLHRISSLGIPWHDKKGDPDFLFTQVYIGFLWDLPNCSVSLPPEKLARFCEHVHIFMDAYEGHQCPLQEVDHIYGSLCYITFIYLDGQSHLPSISNFAVLWNGTSFLYNQNLKRE